MKQQILISEHIVASNEEIKILLIDGDIREFIPRNQRHRLFWNIKNGLCRTYKGPWGNELIFWDGTNHGLVKTTELRSQEIRQHISDLLFG
jgi:hypothetical protein